MYQPIIDDDFNEEELSSLENFTSLKDLILAGGIKSERARKIMNQFTSNSSSKVPRDEFSVAVPIQKKPKYSGTRKFRS